MLTTARPEGAKAPATFFIDMRDRPWDGSAGVKLAAAWDGIGMRAVETSPFPLAAVLRAKIGAAELAETSLNRMSKVIGGGAFSESSPFAHWTQDVRALGFLRPPRGYAYDSLFATSWM